MSTQPLNLIIPLGGIGSRFQKNGYMQPKPFVRVLGKAMVRWLVEQLQGAKPQDTLVIIYNPKFLTMQQQMERLQEELEKQFSAVKLVHIPKPTRGAAETVLYGVKALSWRERSNPCMLLDGDCFFTADVVSKYREISRTHGASVVFVDKQDKPLYSYVKVTDEKSYDVTEIIEKVKISDFANTGCYCFRSGAELMKYINVIIAKGEMQLSQDQKGEFYTSGVIKAMLDDKIPFKAIKIERKDFAVLGTPTQVLDFVGAALAKGPGTLYRFCFDLDHTLVTGPRIPGDYTSCQPIPYNVALCNWLYDQGHTIIVYTARRMRTHKANVGRVIKDIGSLTLKQLDDFKIKYHEMYFGKPWAHFYIDDKAVCALDDIDKEVGFYPTNAPPLELPLNPPKPPKGKDAEGPAMNLIIPLGGIGSRFQKNGYTKPKPFVRVLGKEMISWLMDAIEESGACSKDSIVLIYNPEFLSMQRNMNYLHDKLSHAFSAVKLVHLPGPTRGAAETVLYGVKALSAEEQKNPCMLLDGDCFYTTDIVTSYRAIAKDQGASIVFEDTQPKPIFSYVKVTDNEQMKITEMVEKQKISDLANTGCYCFRSGVELKKYIELIIEKGEKQLSQDQKGEFYTSGVIKAMLRDGIPFKAIKVNRDDFAVLGTPLQVEEFVKTQDDEAKLRKKKTCDDEIEVKKGSLIRFCFDIDSLFTAPKKAGDYSTCKPISRVVDYLNSRYTEGHHIILYTSRSMETAGQLTLKQLKSFGIKFHEVSFNKPTADFYIDDKGVSALEDLPKVTGYYNTCAPESTMEGKVWMASAAGGAVVAAVAGIMAISLTRRTKA